MLPIAIRFMNKVQSRVTRMANGEDVGPLVDSELEDLQIDFAFENQRHMMEIATSHGLTMSNDAISLGSPRQSPKQGNTIISRVGASLGTCRKNVPEGGCDEKQVDCLSLPA
jgi:hypothetical protein